MSRPHAGPRLAAIDGEALGEEAQRLAEDYLHTLAMRLSVDIRVEHRMPRLKLAVQMLTSYAQGHQDLDAPVEEYLKSVCEALWIRPIDQSEYKTPELDAVTRGDLDELKDDFVGRLCVVMVAALGREAMARGERVSVAQLAALLGYTARYVTMLGHERKIKLSGNPLTCSAAEAKRLLTVH